jgi:hypothetical protein
MKTLGTKPKVMAKKVLNQLVNLVRVMDLKTKMMRMMICLVFLRIHPSLCRMTKKIHLFYPIDLMNTTMETKITIIPMMKRVMILEDPILDNLKENLILIS